MRTGLRAGMPPGAPLVIILTTAHASAAIVAWAQAKSIGLLSATDDVLSLPGLITASIGTVILLLIGVASLRVVRRRVSYERWHLLHLLTYLAVGLGSASARGTGSGWPQMVAGCLGAAVLLCLRAGAAMASAAAGFPARRHRLRVEDVRQESKDVTSVLMSGQHLDELRAEPGQFFRWRFLPARRGARRTPSPSPAPPTPRELRITIKANGDGTRRLFDITSGTLVFAEGPYGVLTRRRRRRPRVLLIAGGVGITPMRSLFEAIDLPGKDVHLVYRASREQGLVLKHELDEIAERSGARVVYLVGPTSDAANDMSAHALNRIVGDLSAHDVYLCASPRLASRVRDSLMDDGFPRHQLHEERFTF